MLLPIPEVQSVPIFIRDHILQVEPRLIGPGRRKLSADHDVVARLIPEVIIVDLARGLLLPASGNIEVFIQQQEPARAIFFGVAQHRDLHLPIRQTMDGMRSAQVRPGLDLLWLDDLVELGRALIGGIQDVNAARAKATSNQEAPRFALIVVAGAASIPAKMMHFIFICHTCLTLLSLYERTLTVLSLSSNTHFASNGHISSTCSGVYSSSIVMCDRSLRLARLRANNRLVLFHHECT